MTPTGRVAGNPYQDVPTIPTVVSTKLVTLAVGNVTTYVASPASADARPRAEVLTIEPNVTVQVDLKVIHTSNAYPNILVVVIKNVLVIYNVSVITVDVLHPSYKLGPSAY